MTSQRRRILPRSLILAALLALSPPPFYGQSGAIAATGIAVPVGPTATAWSFLDTLGVGAHWEQRDGVYGRQTDALIASILRLGMRHVRGFDPRISNDLARRGVSSMLVAGPEVGKPAAILALVRTANAGGTVIDAVEGPNEADLFWPMHGYSYQGEGFPAGVAAYQRDIFAAFKTSSDQSAVLIVGPSLGKTYDPGAGHPNPLQAGSLSRAVDLGNFHPYPFGGNSFSPPFRYGGIERYYWNGNFPSANLDEFPYQFQVYASPFTPRPMAVSETGYPTWRDGVSEAIQAVYLPRLFAEYFRLGIQRTYLYELADNRPDPSGQTMDDHFGLLHNDLTPKPGYEALRSLIALLGAGAQRTVQGPPPHAALTVRMPPGYDRTAYVHSLLLRVSDTQSFLLIWHEVATADTSFTPPRAIAVPAGGVDITTSSPYRADAWYEYGPDWQLHRHVAAADEVGATTVPLQDRIVAVSLRLADMR